MRGDCIYGLKFTMKRPALFCSAILAIFLSHAQPTRGNFEISEPFTELVVFGPAEVMLVKAEANSLEVEYQRLNPSDIIIDVHDGVLTLKFRNRKFLEDWKEKRSTEYVRMRLYYKQIEHIEAEAGARIVNEGVLVARNLLIESSKGSEVRLNLSVKNLYLKITMGAIVRLSGVACSLETKINMGSELQARKLKVQDAFIQATMGAEADLHVEKDLEASASMGAIVFYSGKPNISRLHTSLGGEIASRDR
jgi:hypothetical protein